ncbi:hypothetical protein NFI96_034115 [Prochilodus magdalenae]|nr:hypothetical protein NFI96_034115 [Prochilodus magdalenae]
MSGTAVPLSNTANGYTIVSQVLSQSSEPGQVISSLNPVQKFQKGWPKTLGVRAALVMNVISSVAAGIAIILFSLYFGFFGWRHWGQLYAIHATLLIISIIQFITCICVSSFACRATCSPGPYVNITVVANPEGGSMYPLSTVNTTTVNSLPTDSPPPYSEIKDYPDY